MSVKFVVSHLDEQMGPFTEDELKAKWQKGELLPIDYVFDEVKQDWILLSERFNWGVGKNEPPAPPPVGEVTVKRKRPDAAMLAAQTPLPPMVPTPAPKPAPPTPSVTAAPEPPVGLNTTNLVTAPPKGADVHLVGGLGEVDLSTLTPGSVELGLQTANGLKLANPLKIQVHAAEPATLQWKVPERQTAGADAEIVVTAFDKGGHLCRHYSEKFVIRVGGSDNHEIAVDLKNGEGSMRIQHTKAEAWPLSLHYFGNLQIKMPENKVLLWEPGPATQLVLDGPHEFTTGQPLKIKVKAIDNFGNLANNFQGTITLEIKAS